MVIGVFIAPILLYWEALSSESSDKAIFSAARTSRFLTDPVIAPLLSVGSLNHERSLLDFQDLVAVGRAWRNSTEGVTQVGVEKRASPQTPSAIESRNDLCPKFHFAGERPIPLKGVVTALLPVCVAPVAHELGATPSFHAGTGAQRKKEKSGKDGFHLVRRAGRLTRSGRERNSSIRAKTKRAIPGRIALCLSGYSKN